MTASDGGYAPDEAEGAGTGQVVTGSQAAKMTVRDRLPSGAPDVGQHAHSEPMTDEQLERHIRFGHWTNTRTPGTPHARWHYQLHQEIAARAAERKPLLCRLGLHRWRGWSSMDYGRYVERHCQRDGCHAEARRSWYDKRWVRFPTRRAVCTHAADGGPLYLCGECRNGLPGVWRR